MSVHPDPTLFAPPAYCRAAEKMALGEDEGSQLPGPVLKPMVSNPAKLLNLVAKLTDNSSKALEVKINRYFRQETESHVVFVTNMLPASEEAVVQVINEVELDPVIRMPLSEEVMKKAGVQGHSSNDKPPGCLHNIDHQLKAVFDVVLNDECVDMAVVPILSHRRHGNANHCASFGTRPILLVCFVKSPKEEAFLARLVHETFRYCLTVLLNTAEAEEEARQKRQCQVLLGVARKLFSHLEDLNDLLKEIMSEARSLTNAERCSLFLLDPDHMFLVAKVFDGMTADAAKSEVRIAKDQGIAGHVARTGELLNIKDAYTHPMFYKGMDEATGFRTRNILCFPIKDEHGIVGVAQLCNKKGGHFDYFDEEIATAFSIYCGISIMHSIVYKEIEDAQARNKLSNELMMYHMKVSSDDIGYILTCVNRHDEPHFADYDFSPRVIPRLEVSCFILKMFEELGFISAFTIRREILTRFILYVEKGYRDTPYHNYYHAFGTAHFAYLCLKNFHLVKRGYITQLEAFAFFIASFCHDLDHRGTNNSFQQQSNSVLANLYSSEGSVMERHHLAQTLCTINTEGCNFLEYLNREDYSLCLDLIKDMILATDLATHFKIYQKQLIMVQEGYNRNTPKHRYWFVCLLMTCADLSDQTKDWLVTKSVAQLVYDEFFTQGDMEKKMGRKPMEMMDRDKANIPVLQIDFLNHVCLPLFKLLATMFPESKPFVNTIKRNIMCWESSKSIFERLAAEGLTSMQILVSQELETEVLAMMEKLERR